MNPNIAEQSELTGKIVVLVIFVLSMILCARSFRREGVNFKCVLSLILVLAGFVIAGVLQMLEAQIGPAAMPVVQLVGLMVGIQFLVAATLAILGLAEYRGAALEAGGNGRSSPWCW